MRDLGRELRIHRGHWRHSAWGIAMGALSTLLLVWASSRPEARGLGALLIGLALTCAVTTLWMFVAGMRAASTRVIAHERGLAWSRGAESGTLAFDEIAEVRLRQQLTGAPTRIVLRPHSGPRVRLTAALSDFDALVAHLAGAATAALPVAIVRGRPG
jgi:hypothetical protein